MENRALRRADQWNTWNYTENIQQTIYTNYYINGIHGITRKLQQSSILSGSALSLSLWAISIHGCSRGIQGCSVQAALKDVVAWIQGAHWYKNISSRAHCPLQMNETSLQQRSFLQKPLASKSFRWGSTASSAKLRLGTLSKIELKKENRLISPHQITLLHQLTNSRSRQS